MYVYIYIYIYIHIHIYTHIYNVLRNNIVAAAFAAGPAANVILLSFVTIW